MRLVTAQITLIVLFAISMGLALCGNENKPTMCSSWVQTQGVYSSGRK